jgi:tetratricopeptide (TPR) repeat protein
VTENHRPKFQLRRVYARTLLLGMVCLGPWAKAEGIIATQLPPGLHLTDGQDRMMPGSLRAAGELRSRASALYADAMVAFESRESDSQKALNELRQVVVLDPHNDEARVTIANVLLQTGQIEGAFEQLQAATATVPHSSMLDALLGYTQHLRGQNDEAVRLSTRALSRDPTQAVSMRVLLEVAGDQDDLSGAVIHIEDILKEGGESVPASAWLTLGRLYVEIARDTAHALSGDVVLKTLLPIYQQAAAKPPPDVDRLTLLAEAYQDLGRNQEALQALRQAVDLEPANVDVILRCARLEMADRQQTAALKDYEKAYRLNPDLSGLREMLGQIYLDSDKFGDAIRLLQDALAESPDDPGVEADLGLAYEGLRDGTSASGWFQRAFASPSCPPEAYLKLAVFELNDGQIKKAGAILVLARARFPESARVLFYQAVQNRYAKNYPAALACLEAMRPFSSSQSDVFDPTYYLECALNFGLAHQDDRIEPLLREGLAKYPDNSDLMNELAFSWTESGVHLPEALALSKRAAQLDPQNGAIEDTLGWAYFKTGEINDALPYLQRAAILTKNDPVVLQHVGDAWLKLGHGREAIAAWRLALEKDPGNDALTTRITAALAQANHAHSRSAPSK